MVGEGLGASVWEKEGGRGPEQSKAARTKKKPHEEWKTDWQLLGTQGIQSSGHSLRNAPMPSTTTTAAQGQEHQDQRTDQAHKAEACDGRCPAQRPALSKNVHMSARRCSPILILLKGFWKVLLAWLHVPSPTEIGVRSSSRTTRSRRSREV